MGAPISHEQLIRIGRWFRQRKAQEEGQQDGIGRHETIIESAKKEKGHDTNNSSSLSSSEASPPNISAPTAFFTLSELLRGTKVYTPPPPKKPEPVRLSMRLLVCFQEIQSAESGLTFKGKQTI